MLYQVFMQHHNDPRSGRQPIDFIATKVLAALERGPFHSTHSLADIVGVSYSIVIRHLRDSLGIKSFHLHWLPHELTPDLRRYRFEICGQPLPILEATEFDSSRMFVIGDKDWFVLE
jgi:hypothetical protein